jgi:hypothetical protein
MRNPRRGRNISLAFLASGIVAAPAAFLLPDTVAGDMARGMLFVYGVMAILFGGVSAMLRHAETRAWESLRRGEDIIARWRVDSRSWREFLALKQVSREAGFLPNELMLYLRKDIPANGVEVIVSRNGIEIDGAFHHLPARGTPEVTHAALDDRVQPACIELGLYYPRGGYGASGIPRPSRRTVLRFPVARGAQRDAERVVAHYSGSLPGKPDFFHGAGDGRNPEDLSKCYACGYETYQYRSHCPRCGAGLQSRRWSRRFGWGMLACGLIITAIIGAVIFYTAPMLLRPGVSVGGARFSGTAAQASFVLGVFGIVAIFGVTAAAYGLWQIRTGRRNKKVIYFVLALAGVLWLIAASI